MNRISDKTLKSIKLIITDLDNTALKPDKTLSVRTVRAFTAARDIGIHTGVDTARVHCLNEELLKKLGVDCEVSNDGATVYFNGKLVYSAVIPEEKSNSLLKYFHESKACSRLTAITENCLYTDQIITEYDYQRPNILYHDFNHFLEEPVFKILAELDSPELAVKAADEFGCRVQNYRGESLYCFVMPETGKLYSLERLCEVLGITLDEVVAFGDDYGDIEMIRGAGIGVAMDNAIPEVKAVADYVCGSNVHDGVAEFIEQFILQ